MTLSQLYGNLTLHCIVMFPNFLPLEKERDHNEEEDQEVDTVNEEDEGFHDPKVTTGN